MADPYQPPQGGPYTQDRTPRDPAVVHSEVNIPAATERSGGFSTGMLVALVIVVVGLLAALLYRPSTAVVQQTAPAVETAPAAPAATAVVPDAAPVAPDAAVTPDVPATDPAAPQAVPPAADGAGP